MLGADAEGPLRREAITRSSVVRSACTRKVARFEEHQPPQPDRDLLLPANAAQKLFKVHGDQAGDLPVIHSEVCITGERLHVEVYVPTDLVSLFEHDKDEASGVNDIDWPQAGPGLPCSDQRGIGALSSIGCQPGGNRAGEGSASPA